MAIDIGISEEDRKSIVDGLSRLLSDTYVLYLKTHNFHWNVTGPMFRTLHLMFEEQYNELALAVDSIAERIRALGFPAPGAYATRSGYGAAFGGGYGNPSQEPLGSGRYDPYLGYNGPGTPRAKRTWELQALLE